MDVTKKPKTELYTGERDTKMDKRKVLMNKDRWIGQLNDLYWKILMNPESQIRTLDKANEAICECIEKLRPLIK